MELYIGLLEKAKLVREIPTRFRGTSHSTADGAGAAQMRKNVDASYDRDGDPATCAGWDALSAEDQATLAADFTEWQTYVAAHYAHEGYAR
jgi:hypothetical protein